MARHPQKLIPAGVASSASSPPHSESAAGPAILLAIVAVFGYLVAGGQGRFHWQQTDYAHHILMADAMIHGQLHIRPEALGAKVQRLARQIAGEVDDVTVSASDKLAWAQRTAESIIVHDWAIVGDRLYGYWGPTTPVMTIPFVALFGPDVSDQLISILFGSANVGLFYWLLTRVNQTGLCLNERSCRIAMTVLLAFGTSHLWLACSGQIWFAVQMVTLTFLLLAMIAACSPADRPRDALLSGLMFGAAILARSIVLLLGPFFVLLLLYRWRQAGGRPSGTGFRPVGSEGSISVFARRRALMVRGGVFLLPVIAALGVQGLYNYGRFGDFRQSGLEIQITSGGDPRFAEDLNRYGVMSPHFIPRNLKCYFCNCSFPRMPDGRIWYDEEGNSVFLMTPLLLYVFLAWRRWTGLTGAALAGVAPLVAALMLFQGTGWRQFGPRYLLDCTPLLLLVALAGMRGHLTNVSFALIAFAVGMQLFGTTRMLETRICPPAEWWATLTSIRSISILVGGAFIVRLCWWGYHAHSAPSVCPSARRTA